MPEEKEKQAARKIIHAIRWYKATKQTIIQLCMQKLDKAQRILCRLFRGYLFRRAFLSNSVIFMDIYLPEGPDEDVEGTNREVYAIWDFNDDPWRENKVKCQYSEFFHAYTTTLPMIDGTQFKFIVDGELMTSSLHPTHYDLALKTENNIFKVFNYIFENETLGKELNNCHIDEKGSKIHGQINKHKIELCKDDDFFRMESEGNDPPSPPMKIPQINLIECTPDKNLDKLNNEDASPSGKGLTIRVKSECFNNKEIGFYDKEESESSQESEEYQKNILHSGVYHIGKDCDENSSDVYEDSSFLHPKGIGIVDGVSSWTTYFIRTDLFANELMENAKFTLEKSIENLNINPQNGDENDDSSIYTIDPCKIMEEAFSTTTNPGSSTCCIGVLNNNKLDIANLGDSGFMAFEYKYDKGKYKVFLKEKSKPQQHSFNYPLQLVRVPGEETHKRLIERGSENLSKELARLVESDAIISSSSKHADTYSISMKGNRIIVFGTDGLFDNF